jgi:hypothetical protein
VDYALANSSNLSVKFGSRLTAWTKNNLIEGDQNVKPNIYRELQISDLQNKLERIGVPVPCRDELKSADEYFRELESALAEALESHSVVLTSCFPVGSWEFVKEIYVKGAIPEIRIPQAVGRELLKFDVVEEDPAYQSGGRYLKLTGKGVDALERKFAC